MPKKKRGESGNVCKLGAPDHFTGFKAAFLNSKAALYQEAVDSKAVGPFYSKVTREFIMTFGPEEPFNMEPPGDPLDPDGYTFIPLPSTLLLEEREELYTKLRMVS
jgi:hypothetical protein